MANDPLADVISLDEAAGDLGIKPVTLRAAAGDGRFYAKKVGNTWITTHAAVEAYRRDRLGKVGRPNLAAFRSSLEAVVGRDGRLGVPQREPRRKS